MDLHHLTLPGAIGDLHFEVGRLTGFDRLLVLLPEKVRLHFIARRIVRDLEKRGATFDRQTTFAVANTGPWQIIVGEDHSISVRPWRPKAP